MYEAGVDLVVTPYRGRPVESPWWRTAPNPTYREGESYQAAARRARARSRATATCAAPRTSPEESRARPAHARDDLALGDAALEAAPRAAGRAREARRGDRLHGPDGALPRHPDALRERFGIPIVFYDGDVPMSLPEFGGMDTGFNSVPRRRSVGVRPRALELRGRHRRACSSSARAAPRRSSGAPTPSSSRRSRSRRRSTSSSTATGTSSGATG